MSRRLSVGVGMSLVLALWQSESRAQFEVHPPLLGRLASEVPYVRGAALLELAERGPGDEWAMRQMARLLVDPDPEVRDAAVIAFHDTSPDPQYALPVLAEMLADPNPAAAAQAAQILASFDARVVPYLSEALTNPRARYWAARVIQGMGPRARRAAPALMALLSSDEILDPLTRRTVIDALGAMGADARGALPALLEELDSDEPATVLAATYALGAMGRSGRLATSALQEQLLDTTDPNLRTTTAWALAGMNPDDASIQNLAFSTLIQALTDPEDARSQQTAARALVDLQPNRDTLFPQLADALDRSSPAAVQRALQALADVGQPALPGLAAMLQYERTQATAAQVLQQLGPAAAAAVPMLIEQLPAAQPAAQREMLFALARIGAAAAPAAATMAELTERRSPQVRYAAIYALGELGPDAAAAAQLQRLLASDDPFTRFASAWSLVQVEPASPALADATLPVLTEALKHDRPFVRGEAASALGQLGVSAAAAVPRLREAADADQDPRVRQLAREAIAQIRY